MWSKHFQESWGALPYDQRSEGGTRTTPEQFHDIAETIATLAAIQPSDRVLDLGCSIGAITAGLAPHCAEIIGVDFLEDSLKYAREHNNAPNIRYLCSDLSTFTTDDRFDCVVINNVIHCLDSLAVVRHLLQQAFRQLEPGGRLYLGEVPDRRKYWRAMKSTNTKVFIHSLLPTWSLPMLSRLRGRPLAGKTIWFDRDRIAHILGCPAACVAVEDQRGVLLNPLDRSHFIVTKPETDRS